MKKIYCAPEIELISFVESEKLATNDVDIEDLEGVAGTSGLPEGWD